MELLKLKVKEKLICIVYSFKKDIENSPVISDFLSDSLLKQKENRLKEPGNFSDDMEKTRVVNKKESIHNSKYGSVYDKPNFMFESKIKFLRPELAKRKQIFKN